MSALPKWSVVTLALCAGVTAASANTFGDAARGEAHFNQCRGCHQVGDGAQNRIGPQLNGIFGRTAATMEGFNYSKAFQRAGAKGLEWHAEQLDVFLENPKQLVPGTRMSFRGIEDADERADAELLDPLGTRKKSHPFRTRARCRRSAAPGAPRS